MKRQIPSLRIMEMFCLRHTGIMKPQLVSDYVNANEIDDTYVLVQLSANL